jgi:hypothetical protein
VKRPLAAVIANRDGGKKNIVRQIQNTASNFGNRPE